MVSHDALVDLTSEVSLQTADDVLLGESLFSPPAHVGDGRRVILHPNDDGSIERGVGLAVPTAIEPVLVRESRRGGDGTDAAELRERRLGVDSFGVVAEDDEHLGGDVGADAERFAQRWCSFPGESIEQLVVLDDLFTESYPAPSQ